MPKSASLWGLLRTRPAASASSLLAAVGLLLVGGVLTLSVGAADVVVLPYDQIEEDWEVVIADPDPNTNAPQVINVISPTGTLTRDYAVFELNHCTQPDYFEGGMQLQMWSNDEYESNYTPQPIRVLATPGETIRYTLAMSIENGMLKVRIKNGTSTTWGDFGGDHYVVSRPARVSDLSRYSTSLSTAKSRVGFAAHRVNKFALKMVRYYMNNQLVRVDETYQQLYPPAE